MDRDEYHQSASHGGLSVSYDHRTDRGGKPSEATNSIETQSFSASFTAETSSLEPSASTSEPRTRKRKSRWDSPLEPPHSRNRNNFEGDDKHCIDDDDDIPPGFSTPCNIPIIPLDASTATHHQEREMQMKQRSLDIVMGDPWLRFSARIPVTYGIPYSIMQHFEFPQAEIVNGWTTAPGMPFHPFPPLPPSAPVEVDRSTSARSASTSAPIEMAAPSCDTCLTSQIDQQNTPENNAFQQGNAGSLTRKFFRQQKWNQPKLAPPWVRMRNGWGSAGNNARNVSPGVGLPSGGNDFSNSCNAEDYRREF